MKFAWHTYLYRSWDLNSSDIEVIYYIIYFHENNIFLLERYIMFMGFLKASLFYFNYLNLFLEWIIKFLIKTRQVLYAKTFVGSLISTLYNRLQYIPTNNFLFFKINNYTKTFTGKFMSTIFQSLNFPKYMLNYFIDFSFSGLFRENQGRNVYNNYNIV